VFDSCKSAVDAAMNIRNKILENNIDVEIRVGVELGPPLSETGNFFEGVHRTANHFCFVSANKEITVSSKVMQLYSGDQKSIEGIKVINSQDEKFLEQVMRTMEKLWDRNEVTVVDFATELGMSKSQLSRRLKSISSLSPNDLFKEFRLRKSISLVEDNSMNIAEITMAIGFSNPSYFTKCFRERFGKAPSEFMVTV
jgi:AraC-like DNA-binding protein